MRARSGSIAVYINPTQRRLLLECGIPDADTELRLSAPGGPHGMEVRLTRDQLDGLLDVLAAATQECVDAERQKQLERLYIRLEGMERDTAA